MCGQPMRGQMIKIKRLKYKDITDSFLQTLESLRPTGLTVPEAREIFNSEFLNKNLIYIAILDGEIVGTATLILERKFIHKGGMVGHIEDVAVRKDMRERGVGTMLIQYIIHIAKIMRCYKLILDCESYNGIFYERLGFYKTKEWNMRLNLDI